MKQPNVFRQKLAKLCNATRFRAGLCAAAGCLLLYLLLPGPQLAQQSGSLETFGFPLAQPGRSDCVPPEERARIERKIADFQRLEQATNAARPELATQPYSFFPQAGTLWQDLLIFNYVDLDSTSGIRDWDCSDYTYNGHQGHDSDIRTFKEQEGGVPVFAVLDGTVIDTHDGEPDMNTAQGNRPANYVILSHGSNHTTLYYHFKNGSVAVSPNQIIKAGTQLGLTASSGNSDWPHLHFESRLANSAFEPSTGECRATESTWTVQTPIQREMYIFDFFFSDTTFTGALVAEENNRVGTFVKGARLIPFRIFIGASPANPTYLLRFVAPDNSVRLERSGTVNSPFYKYGVHTWNWNVNLDVAGTWRLQYSLNNQLVADAPFTVVENAPDITNRPPNAIQAVFDPPAPKPSEVVFCRVQTSLVVEDADYDRVRYRYQWWVKGNPVRDVTSAALSDALPKDAAQNGELLTCTVTPYDGKAYGTPTTVSLASGTPAAAVTSGASYSRVEQAPESLASAFGENLATTTAPASALPLPTTLGGTTVKVRDALGVERFAPLLFVSPLQVNYQLPAGTAPGFATITITSGDGKVSVGGGPIAAVAPGVFAANANAKGVAAGEAVHVRADSSQVIEPLARFDVAQNRYVASLIDVGPENEQLFLALYGTGWRFGNGASNVKAEIDGVAAEVTYAGKQPEYVGVDQINLRVPRTIAGRGEVSLKLTLHGKRLNPVTVTFK
jgi:uncharacterized protein (TIGR03437 family)